MDGNILKKINKQEIFKKIIFLPLLLVIGALVGTLLLTIGFAVPINQNRAVETFTTINGQSSYHSVLDMRNCSYFFSNLPGVLDTATDGLMLQTALSESDESCLYQAMDMKGYSYYWHGYVVILRVLNLFLNYSDIRFLNFILQFLLVFFFAQYLYKNKGKKYSFLFLTSYLLLMPMALYYCLQFSWIFYIALGASFILIKNIDFFDTKSRYIYFFTLIGLVTCFFDLLTYPLVSWAFPVLWWVLCSKEDKKSIEHLKNIVFSGFAWIFGYAGMWISKCLIGSLVLKRNVLQTAIDEVFIRVGAEEQVTWSSRFDAIKLNWEHYTDKLYILVIVLWLGWFIYKVLITKMVQASKFAGLMLVGVSPIVWYFVLTNHTTVHHFFTYRIFNITILALMGMMVLATDGEQKRNFKFWSKKTGLTVVHLLIVCILAFGGTWLSRTESTVDNLGRYRQDELILEEGQTISMNFVPQMSYAVEFGIQFEPKTEDGWIEFKLLEGEKEVDSRTISFDKFGEELLYYFDVDWAFKAEEYTIQLTVCGEDAKGLVYLGYDGPALLEGSKNAVMDGEEQSGQILVGTVYSYRALPQGADFIYVYLTWLFIVLPIYFVMISGIKNINKNRGIEKL